MVCDTTCKLLRSLRTSLIISYRRDKWAKTQSANPNVKVYLGAPAARAAAGNGYVDSDTLARVAKDAQKKYSSFGGVMLWDIDSAYSKSGLSPSVGLRVET